MLHGETAIAKRSELVNRFQRPQDRPFLSSPLKQGALGLLSQKRLT